MVPKYDAEKKISRNVVPEKKYLVVWHHKYNEYEFYPEIWYQKYDEYVGILSLNMVPEYDMVPKNMMYNKYLCKYGT